MSVSNFILFPVWPYRSLRHEVDFLNDTIKASVLKNTWTPNLSTQTVWGDISANETTDPDYAQLTLGTKVINLDGSNRTVYDCADFDYGDDVSISGRYLVLWRSHATAGLRYLFGYWDLNVGGGDINSIEDDFDFAVNANGIFRLTPNP